MAGIGRDCCGRHRTPVSCARLRRDGFAWWRALASVGRLVTRRLWWRGQRFLFVNAQCNPGGHIGVAVVDGSTNQSLEGRSFAECLNISGDSTKVRLIAVALFLLMIRIIRCWCAGDARQCWILSATLHPCGSSWRCGCAESSHFGPVALCKVRVAAILVWHTCATQRCEFVLLSKSYGLEVDSEKG